MSEPNKKSDLKYSDFHNEDIKLRVIEAQFVTKISTACHETFHELGLTEEQIVEYLEKFTKFYKAKLDEIRKEKF